MHFCHPIEHLLFFLIRILICHACARTHCLRLHGVPPIICMAMFCAHDVHIYCMKYAYVQLCTLNLRVRNVMCAYIEYTCTQYYVCICWIYVYAILRVETYDLVMLCMHNTQNIHERNIQHVKSLYVSTICFPRTFSNRTYMWMGYVTSNKHMRNIQRNVPHVTLLNVGTFVWHTPCTFPIVPAFERAHWPFHTWARSLLVCAAVASWSAAVAGEVAVVRLVASNSGYMYMFSHLHTYYIHICMHRYIETYIHIILFWGCCRRSSSGVSSI